MTGIKTTKQDCLVDAVTTRNKIFVDNLFYKYCLNCTSTSKMKGGKRRSTRGRSTKGLSPQIFTIRPLKALQSLMRNVPIKFFCSSARV